MLWNKMKAVRVIDDHFAVGISDDAVIVAELVDSLRAFEVIRVAPVDFLPTDLKEFDTLLIVRAEDNRLSAYRIASLPDLECLWTVDPGIVFADFTFHEKSLYFSSWYDGLWRFTLDADNRAQFVDSSMVGILMTDLAIDNDTLYALDEYNGIARYALDGYDFGQFLDYLYVSFEASGFVRLDSIFLITQKTGGVVTGSFGRQGLGIIDTLADVGNPRQIYLTADELVFVEDRFVRVLNRSTLEVTNITEIKIGGFTGDMFIWKGREHLILPRDERGLIAFDLLNPYLPRSMLYRSGPVEDILVVDGRLITGGGANPIDVFSFDVDLTPQLNYTMYEDLTNVQALQNNGDTLIAYLADSNKIVFIVQSLDPDSFFIERSFYLDDTLAGELLWLDHKLDSVNVIMTVGRSRIQTYTISDSTIITAMEPWHFEGRITSILVHSNILFVATSRNQLSTHLITPDFELEQLSIENLTGPAYEMIWTDNRLLVPVYYDLAIYDMTDPRKPEVDTVINLPLTVLASDRTEETLCMVGPEGIGVMDMTGDYPELIAFGGEGGTMIDVDGDLLVASDGGSINIYNIAHTDQPNEPPILPTSFVTEQNYPNPFNTGTTIQYCLFTRSHVEIDVFNVLGQRVRTLVNADQSANSYEITWDGTNNRHQSVASGVYFYRVRAGDFVATRKMLLLK
ncbi:MAG: T9SS type A sorting domain-containing protein [candidate division Zixibacteria bacterium]|nr:T9SS type A sorting domain-containing protein [candidate division Zixibacteria bacterium]